MKLKTRWLIHLLVLGLPFGVPLAAGFYWLWQQQWLLLWLAAWSLLGGIWWLLSRFMSRSGQELELIDLTPSVEQTEQGKRAYEKIEQISTVYRDSNPDLESLEFYTQALTETMKAVAEQYYPQRKNALLEIKLPHLLKIIEMLAQELRVNLADNVPGSHMLSVNDMLRSRRLLKRGQDLYRLFRVVSAGLDPVSAMVRELRIMTTDSLLSHSSEELKRWLVDAYIKKIGYYAIELYSGNMILDDSLFDEATRATRRELDNIKRREEAVSAEPLRILVLGQTNAGKSSLVNALFGAHKAETNVMPTTEGFTAYLLERPQLESVIIVDCEGYGSEDERGSYSKLKQEIVRSDIIVLVVSASNVARDPDKKMLQAIQSYFESKDKNSWPAIVVALSHIDLLRPVREWQPPYDVFKPDSAKAQAIRQAMDTVAAELGITLEQIAPVNLQPGLEYNVEEGLVPAICQQLGHAKQVRYLRCLKAYHKEDYWRRLWRQSKGAGQFIAKKGFGLFTGE